MDYNKFCDTKFKKGDAFTAIVKSEKKTLVVKYKGGSYLVAKHPFLKGNIYVYYNNIISYTKQYNNENPIIGNIIPCSNKVDNFKKRFKCVYPTSTLTRNIEYYGYYKRPAYSPFSNRFLRPVHTFKEAKYISVLNDYGRKITVSKERFIQL